MRALLLLSLSLMVTPVAACPPEGYPPPRLQALKAAGFAIDDDAERQRLALALTRCLDRADPALRDGIAYEALATWLRASLLDVPTRQGLLERLMPMIETETLDPQGFGKPFAALVLSEVARSDRVEPWMSAEQRATLVELAAAYLADLRDYRGFDTREGWRHGVAHGADLALQLIVNTAVDKPQIDTLLHAVAEQVAPAGEHAYIFNEPERLARPVLYAALRGLHSEDEWRAWVATVSAPAPLKAWNDAFSSRAGLARRHNVQAFLQSIYVNSRDGESPKLAALAPIALDAIKTLN